LDVFTGIIEEIGIVRSISGLGDEKRIVIECSKVTGDMAVGDSIAVDGACLTVTESGQSSFTAHISGETLSRTTLGTLKQGDRINLERPLQPSDRIGGHMVLGHVDCTGTISRFESSGEGKTLWVEVPTEYAAYIAPKGSVAIDGISLTPVEVMGNGFSVAIIPHTFEQTTLGIKRKGDRVNIEVDIVARYIKRFLDAGKNTGDLNMRKLIEEGFA
jgi:riboflavin synthase